MGLFQKKKMEEVLISSIIKETRKFTIDYNISILFYTWHTFHRVLKSRGYRSMCRLDGGQFAIASQSIEIVARNSSLLPKPHKFTGHSSPVSILSAIKSEKGYFLLSASTNDSFVYMW